MRILVKIGGAQLSRPDALLSIAQSLARARARGHELAIVHGGGDSIRALSARLGLEARYAQGLRVTDAETAEVVLWVLAGEVNRKLVASLCAQGVSAVGLSGADGGFFDARPLEREGAQLGYVGEIAQVRPRLALELWAGGHSPVIASVAPRRGAPATEPFFNVNADHAVAPLAEALEVEAVLFLTDVPGVLRSGQLLPELTPQLGREMIREGLVAGGMVPKLDAAFAAARACPAALVKIASAGLPDALLEALREESGTRILARSAASALEEAPPTKAALEGHHG